MKRREFLKQSLQYIGASFLLPEVGKVLLPNITPFDLVKSNRPPNIVLIVADDLGYHDLGVQGCKDIPTPNIDSIAKNGVRFTDGYVSCPVCSPTRAGLMTGKYQQRFGHEFNPGPAQQDPDFGLSLKEVTIANRLKELGYATGMFGKWHLGNQPEFHPMKRGFDEFYGFMGGAHAYLNNLGINRGPNAIKRGTEPVKDFGYTTETFAREAVLFIERHKEQPFFIYLPFNAVHGPMQTTEKYLSRFPNIQNEKRKTFAGMLSALDDAVGTVLAKLREDKLEENTLIFFISDNGGPTRQTTSNNFPLQGYKGQVLEGGIRIPYMMQWKGVLPAGKVYHNPTISLDILPTAIIAAGGKISENDKLDGVDLLPYLNGKKESAPHKNLYWRFGTQSAIRQGDWKLVMNDNQPPKLYNLSKDIGETTDVSSSNPDKVKALLKEYQDWDSQLMNPKWKKEKKKPSRPNRINNNL